MSSDAYKEVLNQALRLKHEEQLQLIEDLVVLIRSGQTSRSPHSIMELKGLGKALWVGVDVEKYIDDERNSWNR